MYALHVVTDGTRHVLSHGEDGDVLAAVAWSLAVIAVGNTEAAVRTSCSRRHGPVVVTMRS